jgi:hypothetical protein
MANDLRKPGPESDTPSTGNSMDRDRSAILALFAKWDRLAAQAPIGSCRGGMQEQKGV